MGEAKCKHPYGKAPEITWEPAPCSQCGALNEDEANEKCTQAQDDTGEWGCDAEFDDYGISIRATAESEAALDAWMGKVMAWEDTRDKALQEAQDHG